MLFDFAKRREEKGKRERRGKKKSK